MRRAQDTERLIGHVLESIERAAESDDPFPHLRLTDVFPADVYGNMLDCMPDPQAYRGMSGRSKEARLADGTPTRTKIDLLPEATRFLPEVWVKVGHALCDEAVGRAFMRRLAPGLVRRHGPDFASQRFYPIPTLTRDVTGYRIGIHPDTRRKAITVQLYLPRDRSVTHLGTQFHRRLPDGKFEKVERMDFAPNTGYAFAVGDDTWHSLDTLGPEVHTRDTILLTYFVDESVGDKVYNRGKRFGNFVRNGVRRIGI
jgi:hypothetical protein